MKKLLLASLILISIVTFWVMSRPLTEPNKNSVRQKTAKIQLHELRDAINKFYRLCNSFPDNESGLELLTQAFTCNGKENLALLKLIHKDPWGNAWVYKVDKDRAQIGSMGADGVAGGIDTAEDIWISTD